MSTLANSVLVKSIGFGDEKMYIELNSSRVLTVPYTYTKRLENAKIEDLKDYRLIANGLGIHFNKIDEDLSINAIMKDFGNDVKRINISVQESFLDQIDQYAKEHHMTRSALLQKAALEYIAS